MLAIDVIFGFSVNIDSLKHETRVQTSYAKANLLLFLAFALKKTDIGTSCM